MEIVPYAILLLLMNVVQYSSCERFNIVPSPDSPCPGEFTGEPCLTLDQYVANQSLINSNITFELHSGKHLLNSQLRLSNIDSFTMSANTPATVICSGQIAQHFHFDQLEQIYVSGIMFVSCGIRLQRMTNAIFERSSFVNTSCCSSPLFVDFSSVLLRLCNVTNNRVYNGAIFGSNSNIMIEQSIFESNYYTYTCCSTWHGGAVDLSGGSLDILNSIFSSNLAAHDGHGGAVYASSVVVTITGTYFSDNAAGSNSGHGGAIYSDGGSITVTNSTFINNRANNRGGGAISLARQYTNISLINNIFSHNTAAYCGVMEVTEFYHYHVNIIGNTFIYNRAIQQIPGNNGGGVICIRNASILVLDNEFSHNSAAGNAGAIRVDESDIIIERSIFSNNTAGGNGGVLHTHLYPTRYSIIDSSFTNNQAGGDGGVLYVGRAGSHVTVSQGTFGFNDATNRGGVIAIIGSTLEMNGSSIFENAAELGELISACNSNVTITNPELSASQDPIYSFCSLYNSSNTTISMTTEPITPPTTSTITNIVPTGASTTTEGDTLTTTTLSPPDVITSTEVVATTTEGVATTTPPTEEKTTTEDDIITTTFSTTDDIATATTLGPQHTAYTEITMVATTDELTTITPPSQEITSADEDTVTILTHEEASTTEATISSPPIIPPQASLVQTAAVYGGTITGLVVILTLVVLIISVCFYKRHKTKRNELYDGEYSYTTERYRGVKETWPIDTKLNEAYADVKSNGSIVERGEVQVAHGGISSPWIIEMNVNQVYGIWDQDDSKVNSTNIEPQGEETAIYLEVR